MNLLGGVQFNLNDNYYELSSVYSNYYANPFMTNTTMPNTISTDLIDFYAKQYMANAQNSNMTSPFNFNVNFDYTKLFNFGSLNNLSFGKDYAAEFSQKVAGSGSKFKYTASSQQIMRNAGQYFHKKGTYTPKRGDIAIWTKTSSPAHGHVGIVTKVEGDSIWITEGNSGNAVKTNKYSLSKLMSNSGSRPLNGFIDAHSWVGSDVALNAAKRAEIEKDKGVVESSTRGGGSNDSADIRRYKRGAKNNDQWCAYFTSYCFTDGQNLNAVA